MRVLTVLVVLLAGCSSQAGVEQEAPLHGGSAPLEAKVLEVEDGGSMLQGVDERWSFTVPPNATHVSIRASALPIEGNRIVFDLEAQAFHNGTLHTDGSHRGMQGTFGGAGALDLIDISEHPRELVFLPAYAGQWEIVLRGGPQLADYAVSVRVGFMA